MEKQFLNLKKQSSNLSNNDLHEAVQSLVHEIMNTDKSLLSVSTSWIGYGTWKSSGFANEYHFGEELAEIIRLAMTGSYTHDEDRVFTVGDFEEQIAAAIFEAVYND